MHQRFLQGAVAATCTVLTAACTQTVTTPPPADPPRITRFTASPQNIRSGETAQLAFSVVGADSIELVDQHGQPVTLTGDGATVTPTETSVYVLRVSGKGGRDSAYVRVRVDDVDSVFLVAVPAEVDSGKEVSLVWSALGGLSGATLTDGAGMAVPITGASGLVTVTPARSTTYTLTAMQGGGQAALSIQTAVTVRPVITELTVTPPAALSTETLRISWRTAGADSVTLRESTFGELLTTTANAENGAHDFIVPSVMPGDGGTMLPQGYPLSFTLVAETTSPAQRVSRTLPSTIGRGPQILGFELPTHATEGSFVDLAWRTAAVRIELLADGQLVYTATGAGAETGATTFPAPNTNVTLSLVAYDANGLVVRRDRQLTIVKPPEVLAFTAPVLLFSGNPADITWQTRDAATVTVRIKNGPVIFATSDPMRLAMGMAQVRLSRSADLVLEAINAAGERDTEVKFVEVTQQANVSAAPEPIGPGNDITFSWDFTTQMPHALHGVPSTFPEAVMSSLDFFDISNHPEARAVVFPDVDESVAAFTPPQGFVFPFFDSVVTTFFVSTNGFVSFATPSGPLPENLDFDTTATVLPPMLAPWWDNLQLAQSGSVAWLVDGATFPRRLTIQWSRVQGNNSSGSELTFQVQLYETGRFRFIYGPLSGGTLTQAQGELATIGFTGGPGRMKVSRGFNAATAAPDLELDWFTTVLPAGNFVARVDRPGLFTPFYVTATGTAVPAPLRTRVFLPGSVRVSEAMPVAHPTVPLGRYVELFNPGSEPVDVGGLELFVADAGAPRFVLPSPRIIPAQGYYVLGESAVPGDNGDARVQEAWPVDALTLTSSAQLRLTVPTGLLDGGLLSELAWGNLPDGGATPVPGVSISQEQQGVRGNPPAPIVCPRSSTPFGMTGSLGTPGGANEGCYPYRLTQIPPAFENIATTGQKLFTGPDPKAFDDKYVSIPLSPAFRYFGTSYTSLTINTNGWVSVVPFTGAGQVPKVAPGTGTPLGTIAAFWADLDKKTSSIDGSVFTERRANYRIIQWHHFGRWTTAGTVEDMNFEIKLFDTGVIEFHYGVMLNGNAAPFVDGNSATVWIEQPNGATALPISINTAMPRQNTAWRFTPVP
ncbi:MAG: lamin tail domain-containing protein [Myxococcaceae bacterium]|nr:lamin tail domain-containing protein [Myxococcaceae bacterium]